ncbi:hypothetical protein ASPFODRAFT_498446 [Aspergillus luchuensis CBS 106.47]|uniref:Uncharacterized protein n=1 Tax=Aspergillus luchuensis (strain CBS 106.47) TaxID=1137211 RepID=A0A1M3TSC0_ASPLC|nr:hypothetical protein ASPFODRAFT_498446 [Aspergillus luchuensis CBS 106.47]
MKHPPTMDMATYDTKTCAKHRRTRFTSQRISFFSPTRAIGLYTLIEHRRLILYHTVYRDCMRNVKGCRARPAPIAWDDVPPIRNMGCRSPGHIGRSSSEPYYPNSRVVGLGNAKVTLPYLALVSWASTLLTHNNTQPIVIGKTPDEKRKAEELLRHRPYGARP